MAWEVLMHTIRKSGKPPRPPTSVILDDAPLFIDAAKITPTLPQSSDTSSHSPTSVLSLQVSLSSVAARF